MASTERGRGGGGGGGGKGRVEPAHARAGRPVLVPQVRDVPLDARAHDGYRHMARPAEAAHRHAGPRPPFKGAGGANTPMWSPVVEVRGGGGGGGIYF